MLTIQIDSREKPKAITKIISEFQQQGVKHYISKLYVGDYMSLDNPRVVVDRKQNMTEVYCNVVQDHVRFIAELKRAKEMDIKLIFLIEDSIAMKSLDDVSEWENPQVKKYSASVRKVLIDSGGISKFSTPSLDYMLLIAKEHNIKIKKQPVSSEQLQKAMLTISERYDCSFQFCSKNDTGRRIIEILKGE